MPPNRVLVLLLVVIPVLLLSACSEEDGVAPAAGGDSRVVVASTFSVISEFVDRVGGDRVEVVSLIPLGVDEHSYYPPTTLPRELVRADLVLVNGYFLEETLLNVIIENVRADVPVVAVSRGLSLLEGGHVHEFIEGNADRHAIDDAVAEIGAIVESALTGGQDAAEAADAIDAIDAIVHRLPSRSRTEAVRAIDRFVHDVPRGQTTAEGALAGIAEITRGYDPAPGPEATLHEVEAIVQLSEDGNLNAADALARVDELLWGLTLDQRDDVVRDIDAVTAAWRAGAQTDAEAVASLRTILDGGDPLSGTSSQGEPLIDDLVFAEGDPHFWLDARNVAVYVENIRDALIRVDPDGADGYHARAADVVTELEALHQELLTTLAEVPAERRRLVVFHDAFQYFAAAYEFEVIATVAPANPNQARSAAAIAEIIGIVQEADVPTIYREPQYRSQSLDLIAVDSGAAIGIIHSIPSPDAPTYAEMMRANAHALVEGLAPRD